MNWRKKFPTLDKLKFGFGTDVSEQSDIAVIPFLFLNYILMAKV
jgi:hypothetical protein